MTDRVDLNGLSLPGAMGPGPQPTPLDLRFATLVGAKLAPEFGSELARVLTTGDHGWAVDPRGAVLQAFGGSPHARGRAWTPAPSPAPDPAANGTCDAEDGRMLACPVCGSAYGTGFRTCGFDGAKLVPETNDFLVEHLVDAYQIQCRIGDGLAGRVYRARNIYLDLDFAVKVLFGHRTVDRMTWARHQKDAEIAIHLRHPNLIAVHEVAVSPEGLSYLVMEHLEGTTLAQAMAGGILAPFKIIQVAREIALGLEALHTAGRCHGDLKPSSVMLAHEDGRDRTKLLDLGFSASGEERTRSARHLHSSRRCGAPHYTVPEQIAHRPVDARSDLYAFGAILYEMLAGRPPFVGDSEHILNQHLTARPPALADAGPLGALALGLLEKEPGARPPSARAVVEVLDGYEAELRASLRARPVTGPPRRTPPGTLRPIPAPAAEGPSPAPASPMPGAAPSKHQAPRVAPSPGSEREAERHVVTERVRNRLTRPAPPFPGLPSRPPTVRLRAAPGLRAHNPAPPEQLRAGEGARTPALEADDGTWMQAALGRGGRGRAGLLATAVAVIVLAWIGHALHLFGPARPRAPRVVSPVLPAVLTPGPAAQAPRPGGAAEPAAPSPSAGSAVPGAAPPATARGLVPALSPKSGAAAP